MAKRSLTELSRFDAPVGPTMNVPTGPELTGNYAEEVEKIRRKEQTPFTGVKQKKIASVAETEVVPRGGRALPDADKVAIFEEVPEEIESVVDFARRIRSDKKRRQLSSDQKAQLRDTLRPIIEELDLCP